MRSHALAGLSLLFAGCTSQPPHAETAAPSAPVPTTTVVPEAPTPPPSAAVASASASSVVVEAAPSASSSSAPVAEAPLPNVDVKFHGLHVGGKAGDPSANDEAAHRPIISSVKAHTDDFKRCFAKVDDPKKGGVFGIQLIIPGGGGKADVSHPRNGLKGEAFKECMIEAYKAIDFEKPKNGVKTNATYSLMFTPLK